MKITANDVGRKVRLRNGDIRIIEGITPKRGYVELYGSDMAYEPNGQKWSLIQTEEDIIAFVDETPTEPIEFQVGDIVSFGGVEGVVERVDYSRVYPVYARMKRDNPAAFTADGRFQEYHTEPLLKFISRPKKKVKKEVTIKAWYSPSSGTIKGQDHNGPIAGDSQLIELKGEIEVEE